MDLNEFRQGIISVDAWIDSETHPQYKYHPLAQDLARVAKSAEEAGEAIEAFLGYTGQNPRKGQEGTLGHVLDELCDVAITGILGVQHFTKDDEKTLELLFDRMKYRMAILRRHRNSKQLWILMILASASTAAHSPANARGK